MMLQEESGFVRPSVENIEPLLAERGIPTRVELRNSDKRTCEVVVDWLSDRSISAHIFQGFAWGYCGTGPRALHNFLDRVGIEIPFHELGQLKGHDLPGTVLEFNQHGRDWTRVYHNGKGGRSDVRFE